MEEKRDQYKLFEIQVGGIKCTNCANKIKTNISPLKGVQKVSVNVLAEKVQVSLNEKQTHITKITDIIKNDLKFNILQTPLEINLNNNTDFRTVYFQYQLRKEFVDVKILNNNNNKQIQDQQQQTEFLKTSLNSSPNKKQQENQFYVPLVDENENFHNNNEIVNKIKNTAGITNAEIIQEISQTKNQLEEFTIKVQYLPNVIKASQILDFLEQENSNKSLEIIVKDPYLDQFSRKSKSVEATSLNDVWFSLITISIFVILGLIIPQFDFFQKAYIYPFELNIFSFYLQFMTLVTLIVIYKFGINTYQTAYKNYKNYGVLNMETLITLGSGAALIMGLFLMVLYVTENIQNPELNTEIKRKHQIEMIVHMFESAALILAIVICGKYLEAKAKSTIVQMTQNLFPENELIKNKFVTYLEPKNRNFVIEKEKQLEVSMIEKGDLIKLEPGQKLLLDGVVIKIEENEDLKAIDSVCYGWDDPFSVKIGDRLKSGASIVQGQGILQIESTIENCMLFKISNQLNMAQNDQESSEDGIQGLFKTLSDYFVKCVIATSFIVFIVWMVLIVSDTVNMDDKFCVYCVPFRNAISVLVASCPCALGLAIPSVISITLNLAMQHSILIKKNSIFEKIENVQSVIFDKTGTLFTKVEKISDFQVRGTEFNLEQIWQIISLVEKESRHPIAELLYKESLNHIKNCLNLSYVISNEKISFLKNGLSANLKEKLNKKDEQNIHFLIGNKKLMEENQVKIEGEVLKYLESQTQKGNTSLLMALNKKIVFQISLDNTANLREEATQVIEYIQQELKKDVYILSGDSKETVSEVGKYLNIPEKNLLAETDAESKRNLIKKIKQETNKEVMMIGDGLNDILSLQEAGVGVTINAKSEMNLLASDVVALNENLWKIVSLFKLMKYSKIFIYINLFWASIYNIIMLPIAAGVFYSLDFTISPTISSAAMSISSLVVVLFSNLLRLLEYDQSKKFNQSNNAQQQKKIQDGQVRKQQIQNQLK